MKKLFLSIIAAALAVVACCQPPKIARIPATPNNIEHAQPNGDTILIRLFGDERHHFNTTIDGFVIVKNSKDYFCYAKLNKNSEIVPSKYIVKNREKRTFCEKRYLNKIRKNAKLKIEL